jgi:hypothetical protein
LLDRGQQRFNIYCAPCHGLDGYGDGTVARRAAQLKEGTWTPPLNYHTDQVRSRPVGHIFNTITNGIRTMPPYGSQIPVADRWAIVAWVRVLQASQDADLKSLPAAEQQTLEAHKPPPTVPATPPAQQQTNESEGPGHTTPPQADNTTGGQQIPKAGQAQGGPAGSPAAPPMAPPANPSTPAAPPQGSGK